MCRVNFMVKLLRAHGGCLGRSRRRRTWQAAISLGEPQTGIDPGISEWGNPSQGKLRDPPLNSIGGEKRTRGSEPSQYQEEKKETSIAKVVASEIARA